MTDAELIARLREGATWDDDIAAADRIEQLVATNEALIADLARSTRMIAKMVPLSADGNFVFWDGVGDIELDHNGELRSRIEYLEAKLAENEVRLRKAVEIGNKMAHSIEGNYYLPNIAGEWRKVAAEIKGDTP